MYTQVHILFFYCSKIVRQYFCLEGCSASSGMGEGLLIKYLNCVSPALQNTRVIFHDKCMIIHPKG